jgi:hypothetical protein
MKAFSYSYCLKNFSRKCNDGFVERKTEKNERLTKRIDK